MNRTKWNNQVEFGIGDTIKVHQSIIEGEKTRTQVFQGIVIGIKGHQGLTSFTVRKISNIGIGVERIYPLNAPIITKIEVVKRGKVKRAKLYYLRDRVGKKATKVQDRFIKKQDIEAVEATVKVESSKKEEEEGKEDIDKEAQDKQAQDKQAKSEVKPLEASNKSELKKAARARRKAKKKKKVERKERKDAR
jgi:large subunit ribosomal protein L19